MCGKAEYSEETHVSKRATTIHVPFHITGIELGRSGEKLIYLDPLNFICHKILYDLSISNIFPSENIF